MSTYLTHSWIVVSGWLWSFSKILFVMTIVYVYIINAHVSVHVPTEARRGCRICSMGLGCWEWNSRALPAVPPLQSFWFNCILHWVKAAKVHCPVRSGGRPCCSSSCYRAPVKRMLVSMLARNNGDYWMLHKLRKWHSWWNGSAGKDTCCQAWWPVWALRPSCERKDWCLSAVFWPPHVHSGILSMGAPHTE